MAYRIKRGDTDIQASVRRIADDQIGKALGALEQMERPEAIHDVRKRCKKLRGLIRMVRPVFPDYTQENTALRDIASKIAGARDAKVMQDTYDSLMLHYGDDVDRRSLGQIRRRFTLERQAEIESTAQSAALPQVREGLLALRDRAAGWEIGKTGWKAIGPGIEKTHRRARKAAAIAKEKPSGEAFHELRKRIKYHGYHVRLLEPLWPAMMHARRHEAARLAQILGDHHDLSVFTRRLDQDRQMFAEPGQADVAIALAHARQARLEARAWPIADRLLAPSGKAIEMRFRKLWKLWRSGR